MNAANFFARLKALGISRPQWCEMTDTGNSTLSAWRTANRVPRYAMLIVELIEQQRVAHQRELAAIVRPLAGNIGRI